MEREQKLIDIMFEIALTIKDSKVLQKKTNEELCAWVSGQLKTCGFDTEPMGASWGVLKTK
jgi:hypothetical protein